MNDSVGGLEERLCGKLPLLNEPGGLPDRDPLEREWGAIAQFVDEHEQDVAGQITDEILRVGEVQLPDEHERLARDSTWPRLPRGSVGQPADLRDFTSCRLSRSEDEHVGCDGSARWSAGEHLLPQLLDNRQVKRAGDDLAARGHELDVLLLRRLVPILVRLRASSFRDELPSALSELGAGRAYSGQPSGS
jgi:hypothetical protein